MNRELIYAALFNKLKAVEGINTSSRKLKHWADVPSGETPALFQAQTGETVTHQTNQPSIWTFHLDIYVYANTANSDVAPAQVLNPILDRITEALKPIVGDEQTLGGLVQKCRINGKIETDEGTLGDIAVLIIPIVILTT